MGSRSWRVRLGNSVLVWLISAELSLAPCGTFVENVRPVTARNISAQNAGASFLNIGATFRLQPTASLNLTPRTDFSLTQQGPRPAAAQALSAQAAQAVAAALPVSLLAPAIATVVKQAQASPLAAFVQAFPTAEQKRPVLTGLSGLAARAKDQRGNSIAAKGSFDRSFDAAAFGSTAGPAEARSLAFFEASEDKAREARRREAASLPAGLTLAPPQLPLAEIRGLWQPAQGAKGLKLRVGVTEGQKQELEESAVGEAQDLTVEEFKDGSPVEKVSSSLEFEDFAKREYFSVKTPVWQSVPTNDGFAWVYENALYLYDRSSGKTKKVVSALGPISQFAVTPNGYLAYVVAGGSLERWDLLEKKTETIAAQRLENAQIQTLTLVHTSEGDGIVARSAKGDFVWLAKRKVAKYAGFNEAFAAPDGLSPALAQAGNGFYLEKTSEGTRVWRKVSDADGKSLADIGALPFEVKALAPSSDGKTVYAASAEGLVEWQPESRRYRVFAIKELKDAKIVRLEPAFVRGRVLVGTGSRFFHLDVDDVDKNMEMKETQIRIWSQKNPMSIEDGRLRIGEFSFPVQMQTPKAEGWLAWLKRWFFEKVLRRRAAGKSAVEPIPETVWKAVNLPTNKKLIYDTLKGFTMNQHVLYIGETGGGKTWIAAMIAKLTGRTLWGLSLHEHTKAEKLVERTTFGEEGQNRTGLTPAVALQWMMEGGLLLLDEMHKPLEGIAIFNKILQDGEYTMANGRTIRRDPNKGGAIGTMNPVKPPYRGEPPSAELASRFGITLEVKYLPAAEEAALLAIFAELIAEEAAKKAAQGALFSASAYEEAKSQLSAVTSALLSSKVHERLVTIAKDLRASYPDVLPLPISTRTLIHVVEHMIQFPKDDPVDIFKMTYNPSAIVEDSSISEAIDKALEARGLRELWAEVLQAAGLAEARPSDSISGEKKTSLR